MVNSFSEEKKLVFSEHGGYIIRDKGIYDGESTAAKIASQYFLEKLYPRDEKRSIVNSLMLQATIANTLTFLIILMSSKKLFLFCFQIVGNGMKNICSIVCT